MEILKTMRSFCFDCLQEHEVQTVRLLERLTFKGEEVEFTPTYLYCTNTDSLLETEDLIRANDLAMKDAYRKKRGLLTSGDIINIRKQYGISQKDFSDMLDWGRATITRYENHQVQDVAHDAILRKIAEDPKWFIEVLQKSRHKIAEKAYNKYLQNATKAFSKRGNWYLTASIEAHYARFQDEAIKGGVDLNLNKVVEMINYIAKNTKYVYMVRLMKMLWYADMLHYKYKGRSISGLIYSALPMGPVPEKYDCIVELEGVRYERVPGGDNMGLRFKPSPGFKVRELAQSEVEVLDQVICQVGSIKTKELINRAHQEEAYKHTKRNTPIPFTRAGDLTLDAPLP